MLFMMLFLVEKNAGCSCSYCEDIALVIGNDKENNSSNENLIMREDFDRDGSRTICARDRDHEDQTFPSICHMMCYNRCPEFHRKNDNGIDRVFIYKTNYYKLHDGPCPKRMKKI
ncbi:hypothetical protein HCN44_004091 [Aphidius gifuensis]|uniref:Secreted protein n=1 Tax=Aphidius gifuensis TaxID=684658 RepID=A0A835CS55_APHGI|nr:hypothetical protein HCN44_004091 [Aphidius gifuensis]